MLIEEIINGSPVYDNMLKDLAYHQKCHQEQNNFASLRELALSYLRLKRGKEARKTIRAMNKYLYKNPTATIDYAMCKAMLLEDVDVFNQQISAKGLRKLIGLFEINEKTNKTFGFYDQASYLQYWLRIIDRYLWYKALERKLNPGQPSHKNSSPFPGAYKLSNGYPELWEGSDEDMIKIMKLHDRIILDLVPLSTDPANLISEPICKGTKNMVDRLLVNLDFPGKLAYFLNRYNTTWNNYRVGTRTATRYDLDPDRSDLLKKRLIQEFPEERQAIVITFTTFAMEPEDVFFHVDGLIGELLPYYENMQTGIYLDKTKYNRDCLYTLMKCYLTQNKPVKAEEIASFAVHHHDKFNGDLDCLLSLFYERKLDKSYAGLAEMVLDLIPIKGEMVDPILEKIIPKLAEIYFEMGEKEKLAGLLRYYEDDPAICYSDSDGYQEIKGLIEKSIK